MKVFLDETIQENNIIPLVNDGKAHEVKVELFINPF